MALLKDSLLVSGETNQLVSLVRKGKTAGGGWAKAWNCQVGVHDINALVVIGDHYFACGGADSALFVYELRSALTLPTANPPAFVARHLPVDSTVSLGRSQLHEGHIALHHGTSSIRGWLLSNKPNATPRCLFGFALTGRHGITTSKIAPDSSTVVVATVLRVRVLCVRPAHGDKVTLEAHPVSHNAKLAGTGATAACYARTRPHVLHLVDSAGSLYRVDLSANTVESIGNPEQLAGTQRLRMSPNDTLIAAITADQRIILVDTTKPQSCPTQTRTLPRFGYPVVDCAFLDDATLLVACADRTVHRYAVATNLLEPMDDAVELLAHLEDPVTQFTVDASTPGEPSLLFGTPFRSLAVPLQKRAASGSGAPAEPAQPTAAAPAADATAVKKRKIGGNLHTQARAAHMGIRPFLLAVVAADGDGAGAGAGDKGQHPLVLSATEDYAHRLLSLPDIRYRKTFGI